MRIIGLPYEGGGTIAAPPGARLGWRAIRDGVLNDNPHLDKKVTVTPVDLNSGWSSWQACEAIAEVAESTPKTLWIGGDHTVTYGVLDGVQHRTTGPLDVFIIDAHSDLMEDEDLHQVSWLYHALKDNDRIGHVTIIGHRTYRSHHPNVSYIGIDAALPLLQHMQNHPRLFYISVDIDGFDSSIAPGTGNPSSGGFTNATVVGRMLSAAFKTTRCIGMDIVEYNPLLDPSMITYHTIMEIVQQMLQSK